jgi:hypothetical protein
VMGLYFNAIAEKERKARERSGASNGSCIVGLLTGRAQHEPDDEGGPNVEDDETTPLVGGSKKVKKQQKKDSKRGSKKDLKTPDTPT